MKKALYVLLFLLNIPRGAILYFLSRNNSKIILDQDSWITKCNSKIPELKGRFALFVSLLLFYPEFRNVVLSRIKEKSIIRYVVGRILYKPIENLYLDSSRIEGGLFIQHGFSTIVCPNHIGTNCWINQQVTIGYSNATDCPTIGNNVHICAGAIVIGNIKIGDNVIIGAGAVVVNDIPSNTVAVGVPAKVVHKKDE